MCHRYVVSVRQCLQNVSCPSITYSFLISSHRETKTLPHIRYKTCCGIHTFTNFDTQGHFRNRTQSITGTHWPAVTGVPTFLCSALQWLKKNCISCPRSAIICNRHMSTTTSRYICHKDSGKLMIVLHSCQ